MNLRLQYSTRRQTLEGLYDVIDRDTEEYVTTEPLPHEQALTAKKNAEALYTATKALCHSLAGIAET